MTPPLETLFQDEQGDPMTERRSTGEALVTLALGLMREVKEDIKGMNLKLDDIAKERRDEAREHGELEARMKALETFKSATEASHRSNKGISVTALLGAGIALLVVLLKLAAGHPDVLK